MQKLRSIDWFSNPDKPDMTALYVERFLNYGLTLEELQSGKPIIGIAQTGSDLAPCNRHHIELAKRTREGIRDNGGIPMEFPVHPIQESAKRPTAMLDRNLSYLGLVEILYGYPLDGVVLTIGCDKTMPACMMAAVTVNIPAICLSVGPMLNGWYKGERIGSGSIIWKARELLASNQIDVEGFIKLVASSAPSTGHCNTMGTASTMNCLSEILGMQLPGSAAIPAPHRDRQQNAYNTGKRVVDMVWQNITPSSILTKNSFINAIRLCSAIGGSTNAPIHMNAIARHLGIELSMNDWDQYGHEIPLIADLQPHGKYLGEDFYRAGGVPVVVKRLMDEGLICTNEMTVNGKTIGENCHAAVSDDTVVIKTVANPLKNNAGFCILSGNLFENALIKLSGIDEEFFNTYLNNPNDPLAFEGRAIVFDGPEDFRNRIDDPELNIDETCILIMRGVGPNGYPGAAEVVNMRPPNYLIKKNVRVLPCIGDGRQSGTTGSPSILNASPEAAAGGGLSILENGDLIRVDIQKRLVNVQISQSEFQNRVADLEQSGGYRQAEAQTPWQEIQQNLVSQLDKGMVLDNATQYKRIADPKVSKHPVPRDNH